MVVFLGRILPLLFFMLCKYLIMFYNMTRIVPNVLFILSCPSSAQLCQTPSDRCKSSSCATSRSNSFLYLSFGIITLSHIIFYRPCLN